MMIHLKFGHGCRTVSLQTDKRLCGLMDVASSFGSGDFGGFESHLGISEGLQLSKLGKKFLDAKFNVTLEA